MCFFPPFSPIKPKSVDYPHFPSSMLDTRESSSKEIVQDITVINKTGAVVTNSETLLGRGDGDLF